MKFESAKEMYEVLSKGKDLYNPNLEKYVFLYNTDGALCVYDIDMEHAKKLEEMAASEKESWSAFLGIGGRILDDEKYDRNLENDDYLAPSYDFCEETFCIAGWILI